MKLLRISAAGGLELARAHLTRPVVTIGRSPTCDVVLRAQGVAPVHFLLEWVGAGAFDPQRGHWSIFDISKSADESGEGVLLGDAPQSFRDFKFQWAEDRLEAAPDIGGRIRDALESSGIVGGGELLELVSIRADSGSIEEILHLGRRAQGSVLRDIPQFKIEWPKEDQEAAVRVLLREMPGAVVSKRGTRVEGLSCDIAGDDVVQVRWKGNNFYLRFVAAAAVPKVDRKLFQDPTLRNFALVGLGLMALMAGVAVLGPASRVEAPKEPPRVARIEVQELSPDAPPPPPSPAPDRKKDPEPKPEAAGLKEAAPKNNPGQAAAARFRTSSKGPSRLGLNSPAAPKDVNQLGILGAMAGAAPTPGVRADKIINDGLITESVAGEKAAVVVRNPPAGMAGAAKNAAAGNALTQASTTLRGGQDFDPASNGPIARVGGKAGYAVGTGLGEGKGGVGGGFDFASLDVGAMTVSGGLDRETVRKVIGAYKNQIRTCYEKALLSRAKLSGRIVFRWVITAAGPVTSVQITKSEVGSPALESCVTDVIHGMVFPKAVNGNPTTVIYPFVFQSRS